MKKLLKFFLTILSSFFIFSGLLKNTPESDHINQARRMANETTEEAQQETGIIPNTGYVEKIYFNNDLSVEQVLSLTDYEQGYNEEGAYINPIVVSEDYSTMVSLDYDSANNILTIQFIKNEEATPIFQSQKTFTGFDWVGFNPNIDYSQGFEINSNVINDMGGISTGLLNESIVSLVNTTGVFPVIESNMSINNVFGELGTGLATLAVGFGNIFSGITPIFWNAETNSLTIVSVLAIGSVALTIAFWAISKVLSLTKMGFGKR